MFGRLLRAARVLVGDQSDVCIDSALPPAQPVHLSEKDAIPNSASTQLSEYEARLEKERSLYKDCLNVHDLPKIAIYWHLQHLMSKFRYFGISHPGEIFHIELLKRCASNAGLNQVVSIGSGNCDLEVELAVFLKSRGYTNFVIECLDLNSDMLKRGLAIAQEHGVSDHVQVKQCDFNAWNPQAEYDVVIASQSLHHVLNLEHLFDAIQRSLRKDGHFLVSDMIGRNGHMRWPEASEIVNEFWRELPGGYKYNHQLRRYEDNFDNWDCSKQGFEGIRSQDILSLLIERFHFEMILPFGNVIDPFVDRGFGRNFRVEADWDRSFIDRLHYRDEAEMQAGKIKPTHLVAVMRNEPVQEMKYLPPMTPEFAVRPT